jgi:hypothetical protein
MQVILLEKIAHVGDLGDVVKVKDGYGRNFLIPTGRAKRATKAAIAEFEARRAELEAAQAERIAAARRSPTRSTKAKSKSLPSAALTAASSVPSRTLTSPKPSMPSTVFRSRSPRSARRLAPSRLSATTSSRSVFSPTSRLTSRSTLLAKPNSLPLQLT